MGDSSQRVSQRFQSLLRKGACAPQLCFPIVLLLRTGQQLSKVRSEDRMRVNGVNGQVNKVSVPPRQICVSEACGAAHDSFSSRSCPSVRWNAGPVRESFRAVASRACILGTSSRINDRKCGRIERHPVPGESSPNYCWRIGSASLVKPEEIHAE
jgi:hypothetical protein